MSSHQRNPDAEDSPPRDAGSHDSKGGEASTSLPLATTSPRPSEPRFTGEALADLRESALAKSLYIHVPFCFHKCHYCDFYSIVDTRDRQASFTKRLTRELSAIATAGWAGSLQTIFVGGGTPSLLRVDLWKDLLATLNEEFDLSRLRAAGEFTVECNPETVTPELMATLRSGGVTRVSVGAQSFDAGALKALERWHDPQNVARAVALAREAGIMRQSIDLIYAVPGQTMASLDQDLDAALALKTEHISAYALTYEPNTAMTARLRRGEFVRADEDLEADMFEHVAARLAAAGLQRYEVSNFARPGAECRHNLAYWRQHDWLAAGPSASGHLAGRRWKNVSRLDDYLEKEHEGLALLAEFEPADNRRNLGEWLWTGLRTSEGVEEDKARARAGSLPDSQRVMERMLSVVRRQRERGNMEAHGAWRLTNQGFLVADGIAVEFLAAIDP